jgi:hypothetical protein
MQTMSLRSKTPLTLIGRPSENDKAGRFIPYINVLHSERIPQPIFAAALTGAPWRFLKIPYKVLNLTEDALLGYVKWRCQFHFSKTKGLCYLFGNITGFEWVKAPNQIIDLDTRGRVVGTKVQATPSGSGSLMIDNKTIPGSSSMKPGKS